VCVWVCMLAR